MLDRCYNPNASNYGRYGARGVGVCERWRNSFENFLADVGARPQGKTLDRINPDGHYEPGNVRWATPQEQAANKSKLTTKRLKQIRRAAEVFSPSELAELFGISVAVVGNVIAAEARARV